MAPNRNEPSRPQIIIFDKSPSVRYTVGLVLGERYGVEGFGDFGEALGRLEGEGADLVILGMESPFSSYVPFLQSVRKLRPGLPVLFLSTQKTRDRDFIAVERYVDEALFRGGFAGEGGRVAFSGEMGGEECFRFCGGFSVGR